ncbi:MAG: hypothetical protein DHS20C18_53170 [Saprospiraceae bacterium]|nr:MAG: hypothetical protein DHS20C18_53170 [Saprospiraceae bacterium]
MLRKLTILPLLLLSFSLFGQQANEIGLYGGLSVYQGDLVPSPFSAEELNPAFALTYRQFFNPKLALRATALWTELTGSDLPYTGRNVRGVVMKSTVVEATIGMEWHLLGKARLNNTSTFRQKFSPYLGISAGLAFADPKFTEKVELPKKEEDFSTTFFVLPITAGVRFEMTNKLSFSFDFSTRPVFSDYLDGISVNGNPDKDDWFFTSGLTILYTINAENDQFDFD